MLLLRMLCLLCTESRHRQAVKLPMWHQQHATLLGFFCLFVFRVVLCIVGGWKKVWLWGKKFVRKNFVKALIQYLNLTLVNGSSAPHCLALSLLCCSRVLYWSVLFNRRWKAKLVHLSGIFLLEMPAGSDRKWEQCPSKETSLWAIPKPGTEQTCLCMCRQVDVACQWQQLSFFRTVFPTDVFIFQ